jgi:hypothetical protein
LECNEPVLVSRDDVLYKRIDPEYSDGAVWARHINLMNLTDEYDFIYQIDSHILHDQNWDRALIEDYKRAMDLCGHNKVIITGSCKAFTIEKVDDEIKTYLIENVDCASHVKYYDIDPETLIPTVHGEKTDPTDMPREACHIMAGNFFTHTDWVENVGLDPKIFFQGEEVMMAMMSYAAGYKMYHHTKMVSYHLDDTKKWFTKFPPENPKAVRRREILNEIGRWRWKKFTESCREDLLESFKNDFGIDFINLQIADHMKTYELDEPGKSGAVLDQMKAQAAKTYDLPPPLFTEE